MWAAAAHEGCTICLLQGCRGKIFHGQVSTDVLRQAAAQPAAMVLPCCFLAGVSLVKDYCVKGQEGGSMAGDTLLCCKCFC